MEYAKQKDPEMTDDHTDNIDELKRPLPKWIRPDRGGGDRGRLLYIEPTKKRRIFQDPILTGFILLFLCSAMYVVIDCSVIAIRHEFSNGILEGSIFTTILIIMLLYFCSKALHDKRYRPFCVYEHGLSLPGKLKYPYFTDTEQYIPWTEITEIDREQGENDLKISLNNGEAIMVSFFNVTNVSEIFSFFRKLVPEKIGPIIQEIFTFTPDELDNSVHSEINNKVGNEISFVLLLIPYFITGVVLGSWLFGQNSKFYLYPIDQIIAGCLFTASMTSLIIYLDWSFNQEFLLKNKTSFSESGIQFPRNFYGRHVRSFDLPLSFNWIRKAELYFSGGPHLFESECTLTSGEKLIMSGDFVQRLSLVEGFDLGGWIVTNSQADEIFHPIKSWNYKGIIFFISSLIGGTIFGMIFYLFL